MLNSANNCRITACVSTENLIVNNAQKCKITRCQAGKSLIGNTATACTITDCFSILKSNASLRKFSGLALGVYPSSVGIAVTLAQGSIAERCFVWIDTNSAGFECMTVRCDNSTIRFCALGGGKRLGDSPHLANSNGRITPNINGTSTLQDNIALDSIAMKGTSDAQGKDGKSVSAVLFNQHYFENNLGWDFDTVWQWNNKDNRPQLQSVGVGATVKTVAPTQASTDDLLTQQISANIWL